MVRSRADGGEYAMKFFLSGQEHAREVALHTDRAAGTPNPLTQYLPMVRPQHACMHAHKVRQPCRHNRQGRKRRNILISKVVAIC